MSTTQPIKNQEQLRNFRDYYQYQEHNPRNHALIILALNSALRISDILDLHWNDIYEDEKYKTHITINEKKTGKENRIVLNKAAVIALEELRSYLISHDRFNINKHIFCSQKKPYDKLSRSQAFRIVKKAAAQCGLEEHISCHSLRKTFGYFAWKQGVQPALLMSIYNHSSYEITKRYLCIDQNEKDEVYTKIVL